MVMKKIIIANWKANPDNARHAAVLAAAVERQAARYRTLEIVAAPPFPFLAAVGAKLRNARLGSQDIFWDGGAWTGAVSAAQLKSLGVSHAIIGHSERRMHMGETDAMVQKKLRAALGAGLAAVLCVGERERQDGGMDAAVGDQVGSALQGLSRRHARQLVIAYEPVWAISTAAGNAGADTPDHAFRARLYIEKTIASVFGARGAAGVRVIYGGSVTAENAPAFLRDGRMDGLLVGRASLDAKKIGAVIRSAAEVARR